MPSISYIPKVSNQSAVVTPVTNNGNDLKFTKDEIMNFIQQNPEVLTEEYWKGRQALTEGISKGVNSLLSSATGLLTQKAGDMKSAADATTAHERAIEIAKIQSAPFTRPNTSGITFR
jgi:hypothetical protein